MSQTPDPPTSVGQQLKARREALDLTQGALSKRIGIDSSTVSTSERDITVIQRGKRSAWERALQLRAGTISRAYDGGTIEPADTPTEPPYADMTDPVEAAIWVMDVSESDRIDLIDGRRARAAQRNHQQRRI